jgi:hypothetical protein
VAAHNLGIVMRKLFGIGTPRSLQAGFAALFACLGFALFITWISMCQHLRLALSRTYEAPVMLLNVGH